jgi:hypothetical protein
MNLLITTVLLGCTALPWPWQTAPQRTFWDTFDPTELRTKYEPDTTPFSAASVMVHGGGMLTKEVKFCGIRRSERVMARTLDQVRADMIHRVRSSGAEIQGEVRLVLEEGVLRRFEIAYRHHRVNGLVRGRISQSSLEPGWDLECVVEEDLGRHR